MGYEISGRTRVCGLFGFPVEHSFSPLMHNAAFAQLGLDFVYVPFLVRPEELPGAVTAVRTLNLAGVNVTVPHKQKIIPLLDEVTEEARLIGAVNTIVNKNGRLYGHNTDGPGFIRALKEEINFSPAQKSVLILGSGGAARAVAVELALAGVTEVMVANRTQERGKELVHLINKHTKARAQMVPWPVTSLREAVSRANLIVQTTPVGMYPDKGSCPPFPFECLEPAQVVCDLVYNPPYTLFLQRAAEAGAKTLSGLGMLLYQGALAFELWTGRPAPVQVMHQVLLNQLNQSC